jgi:hypothetical protein
MGEMSERKYLERYYNERIRIGAAAVDMPVFKDLKLEKHRLWRKLWVTRPSFVRKRLSSFGIM